ncbi:sterol desaturase family protein [Vibrio palustris]|uniref:Fatty acid hydroxylase superfamily protein n=1 Tax=Vibrio palustris TaxID=1918946 RepID=A0A1R4B2J0_9VIBR|nr:sterol desaturase family protein [Vibrio palustris]SJL83132.1 Fatty acid hydroxylase superfamily protein [Vibrio palustris]
MNDYNAWLQWGFFLLVFLILAIWESNRPRRTLSQVKRLRWLNHFSLCGINITLSHYVIPFFAISSALWAQNHDFGILVTLDVNHYIAIFVTILALDLALYIFHVLMHRLPALWQLHQIHHTDTDLDASTALRFHPLEFLLLLWMRIGVVTLLGAPILGVVAYELIFIGMLVFNHCNIKLHPLRERQLRWLLVTPDVHRIHHSLNEKEHNSNLGFVFSFWDRLLGTYIAEPLLGHPAMRLGLAFGRNSREQWLDRLIVMPFRRRLKK